jgi:hypothetical protein
MKWQWTIWMALVGILLGGLAAPAELARPAWLTDCSLGVKEGYDNNVFLSGVDAKYLPPAYTVPAGSVAALKDCYSWITTVSPKIGVNFSPLTGSPTNLPLLSLAYAPDFAVYHDQTSESYNAHRVLAAVKAKTEATTFSGDNSFIYIDGNGMGPFYPSGLYSAFATTADRERRRQIQDRANVSVQFNYEKWFVRPVASLLYYDLMTEQLNVVGYQNYCDRYDVNGGADFGYKLTPQLALTLGYRYGHQYQQQYSFSPYSSSSDYQRVLVGMEGNPWRWLNLKIQSGPDFRSYERNSVGHITPVNDLNPVKYYGEALVTATFAPESTLTFKYKLWQWVSGSGKVPYSDGSYELLYHCKLTDKLGLDLGGKFMSWDFTSGNLPACQRHDLQYTASAGLNYAINSHVCLALTGALDWGRNGQDAVTNPQTREFNQQLIALGTQWKF